MKRNKSVIALLSSSFLVTAMVAIPLGSFAAPSPNKKAAAQQIDWSVVNEQALIDALKKRGQLRKNATATEIEQAIKAYVTRGVNPHSATDGIDTSTSFGKRAYKSKKAVQAKAARKIAGLHESSSEKKSSERQHVDHAVVALIEFPDYPHNQLPNPGDRNFWVKDFNPEHYWNLLFNRSGFTTEGGKKYLSATQYYLQQSAGFWALDGKVAPWVQAKHDAAYYGAHYVGDGFELNDIRAQALVKETLESVGKQIAGNEAMYDQRDPYDADGDGNVMEPDGLLDNLFIVHSGMGEEAGGGELGDNAIWSHRSVIGSEPVQIPGSKLKAYDYIIQPEDGATGVFVHEYGHNIGLPDEYDTGYSGTGSPVEAWSLMSYGSWTGKVPGTEPTGFSAWCKLFFHELYGGNWPQPTVIDLNRLDEKRTVLLQEAVANTKRGKLVKINLPDRLVDPPTQPLGTQSYFSTKGDMLDTKIVSQEIDLTPAKSAKLRFETWRELEVAYDYLYVNIYADGAATPVKVKEFSDTTEGAWVKEEVDLSAFAGKKIKVEFQYVTDIAVTEEGAYVDNIVVEADGKVVFSDDVEGTPSFALNGFKLFNGAKIPFANYYLIEWRTHHGVDKGLAHVRRNDSLLSYDPGMLVWYYDGRYGSDNMTGKHPGEGFIGVVDAHQRGHYWNNGQVGTTRYQVNDAAFHFKPTSPIHVVYPDTYMKYDALPGITNFYDGNDYSSPFNPAGGKRLPYHGLKINLKAVTPDEKLAWITVSKQTK
ncbi:immune inhibitor A domain-containing protein [Laceyella putida]|uniref:Immune inhibitor A domain-containing protein n=1 Tax=Laceyella putida TaxID=110101 RepID=A0ABW2RJA4_9BACL